MTMLYVLEVYLHTSKVPLRFNYRNLAKLNEDRAVWHDSQVRTKIVR